MLVHTQNVEGLLLPDDAAASDHMSLFTRVGNLTKRVSIEAEGTVGPGVSVGPRGDRGLAGRYGCDPGLCGCREIRLYFPAESIACRCSPGIA